ncbi:HAMP domain-containing histidine kinase [Candidatus Wolfebacteria bacterium]|nr:HAMP domain-containing histidine kinase [Candidatus Wolfebacteria bacterium]
MKRMFQKFIMYAKFPEMRLFWVLLPFLIALGAATIYYLPHIWFAVAGTFIFLAVIVFMNNLHLAKRTFEVKVERNELHSIVHNLDDGVIAYDSDFTIRIVNRAAEKIFTVTRDALAGRRLAPEMTKDSRLILLIQVMFPSLAPVVIRQSATGVYPQITDFSFTSPRLLELRVITDRIIDPRANLLGFVKIVRDRTRETELLKAKTEFISIAAHQLRTPLTAINWSVEGLRGEPLDPKQKELVETAYGASVKLLKTVNDLLDISKIEEGQFGYAFEPVPTVAFLEGVIGEAQEVARQLGVALYLVKPSGSVPSVLMDAAKMKMAFMNLLDNAIRYNVKDGSVTVGIREVPGRPYIEVTVKDTGIGIPADEMGKLFTKFFRAGNAISTSPDGTGLGLYIVKNIVKRHGGDITVLSDLNRGTTIILTLPTDPALVPQQETVYEE